MDLSVTAFLDRIKSVTPLKTLSEIGFSAQVLSNWKSRNSFPKADDLYKIASFLNVSMEWLLTGENSIDKSADIPPDEFEILSHYRQLSDSDKSMVQIMLATMATSKK